MIGYARVYACMCFDECVSECMIVCIAASACFFISALGCMRLYSKCGQFTGVSECMRACMLGWVYANTLETV